MVPPKFRDFDYRQISVIFELSSVQFTTIPDNYDAVYQRMTWQGARVLALGYKNLGELQAKDVCINIGPLSNM